MFIRTAIIIVAYAALAAPSGDPCPSRFMTHVSEAYRFSVLVPCGWTKKNYDLTYQEITVYSRGRAEITLTSMPADEESIARWNRWQDWFGSPHGRPMKIIEEGNVVFDGTLRGSFTLFEYPKGRSRILKKMLIVKSAKTLHVIECGAPVETYDTYHEIFTAVIGSIRELK